MLFECQLNEKRYDLIRLDIELKFQKILGGMKNEKKFEISNNMYEE